MNLKNYLFFSSTQNVIVYTAFLSKLILFVLLASPIVQKFPLFKSYPAAFQVSYCTLQVKKSPSFSSSVILFFNFTVSVLLYIKKPQKIFFPSFNKIRIFKYNILPFQGFTLFTNSVFYFSNAFKLLQFLVCSAVSLHLIQILLSTILNVFTIVFLKTFHIVFMFRCNG